MTVYAMKEMYGRPLEVGGSIAAPPQNLSGGNRKSSWEAVIGLGGRRGISYARQWEQDIWYVELDEQPEPKGETEK